MKNPTAHREAREKLSKFLGLDQLPSFAIVHHIDGNEWNNSLSNLLIVSRAEHARIHKGKDQRYNRVSTIGRIFPKGITYDSSRGNFKCHIRVGEIRYQARMSTLKDAIEWRRLMELTFWGEAT